MKHVLSHQSFVVKMTTTIQKSDKTVDITGQMSDKLRNIHEIILKSVIEIQYMKTKDQK